jgi:hypothetical protein
MKSSFGSTESRSTMMFIKRNGVEIALDLEAFTEFASPDSSRICLKSRNQYQIAVSDFVFRLQIPGKRGKKTLMTFA